MGKFSSWLTNSTWFLIRKLPCWTGETYFSSPIQSVALSETSLSYCFKMEWLGIKSRNLFHWDYQQAVLEWDFSEQGHYQWWQSSSWLSLRILVHEAAVVFKGHAHVQRKNCLTEGDLTSNLCKTALYYQAFLFLLLKPWNGQAEREKVTSEELVQIKQRISCKE